MTASTSAAPTITAAERAAARFADPAALERALADVTFHTPPRNQGQIVEVSYGAGDGLVFRRTHDRSDRTTSYAVADADDCGCFEPWNEVPSGFSWVSIEEPAEETEEEPETTAFYYAVCNCNGPISVLLEADTEEEAVAEFAGLDGRAAIDDCSTDLEDELDIAGEGMSEEQFAAACEAAGARPVRPLEGDGSVRDAWHLWVRHL